MLNKNWKSILNIHTKNIVFIMDNTNKAVSKTIIENEEIIKNESETYYLFPEIIEILERDKSEILKKYTSDFKSFITQKEKKLLITHDVIFSTIVKEDKQKNFIEILLKNKKQIILVSEKKYENLDDLIHLVSFEEWLDSLNVIDKFKEIKIIFNKTFNPFKNPKEAFIKYKDN